MKSMTRVREIMTALAIGSVLALPGCNRGTAEQGAANTAGASAAVASGTPAADGKRIYEQTCISCHGMGAAGAPRVGDAAAWAPRIAKGMDALVLSTVNGLPPGMPAKGLCAGCSEADLRAAVTYMVEKSQAP